VRGDPLTNEGESKRAGGDCFSYEMVSLYGFRTHEETIHAKKSISRGKTCPFIPIDETVVVSKRFHQGCGFLDEIVVIACLRTKNGGFQAPLVEEAGCAAEFFDQLVVNGCDFGAGEVKIRHRLASQPLIQLSIFFDRLAEVAHCLRPHRALIGSQEPNIVLNGFLQKKGFALPVLFGELR